MKMSHTRLYTHYNCYEYIGLIKAIANKKQSNPCNEVYFQYSIHYSE